GWMARPQGRLPRRRALRHRIRRDAVSDFQLRRRGADRYPRLAHRDLLPDYPAEDVEAVGYIPPRRRWTGTADHRDSREPRALGVDAVRSAGDLRSGVGSEAGSG